MNAAPAPEPRPGGLDGLRRWLRSDVTLVLPGWALAAAGAVVLILFFAALD